MCAYLVDNRAVGWCAVALASLMGPSSGSAALAAEATLPTHFAGEVVTVALAFAFPALVAGAYLALQRITQRFGARSLVALALVVGAVGTATALLVEPSDLWQRVGLASL